MAIGSLKPAVADGALSDAAIDPRQHETVADAALSATSYGQILKSTILIGGSSLLNVGFSVIRYKALAVLLGPSGIGLFGLFNSILDLAQAATGAGVQSSGVRQMAEAVGTGDHRRVAMTALVLRRISLILAFVGLATLAVLAVPISRITFGSGAEWFGVLLLGLAVMCRHISGGQIALVQGARRIADLARINVMGAAAGTLIGVPIVYIWGHAGIAPSIVVMAFVTLAASWWYARKVPLQRIELAWRSMGAESYALLRLGLVFTASAVLTLASAYMVRLIVLHFDGLTAAGLYQAAWTIGGLYAGFILQAMGADFYPRLTAACRDAEQCNRLVNEQAQVSILLAGPGVLATLTLAPLIVSILYSAEFTAAVDLLRWVCLGMMLRVIAWPVGYIIIARGADRTFFWTEVAATVVHIGLAWLLIRAIGPTGAGVAFFGLYVWHTTLVYILVRRMTGFRWSASNTRLFTLFIGMSALVMTAFTTLTVVEATAFGCIATFLCGLYSLHRLFRLLPPENLPKILHVLRSRSNSSGANRSHVR